MSTREWIGEATAVTQVDIFTPSGAIVAAQTVTIILTAEDNTTTQNVVVSAPDTTIAGLCTQIAADCNASSNPMFQRLTWSDETTYVSATEKVPGRPFYSSETETLSGTFVITNDGTGLSVLSAGPNDWNTAANWDATTVPITNDTALFNQGSSPVLYGLNQSAVNLNELRFGRGYFGTIGDAVNGFYLQIDVNGSSGKVISINTNGSYIWLDGRFPTVYVTGIVADPNSLRFAGDIDNVYMSGTRVQGTVGFKTGMVLNNVYAHGCQGIRIELGETISALALVDQDAGSCEMKCTCTLAEWGGSVQVAIEDKGPATINHRGGTIKHNGSTDVLLYNGYSGLLDLTNNKAPSLTITASVLYNASIDERSGLDNIIYTAAPVLRGTGQVWVDAGATPAP